MLTGGATTGNGTDILNCPYYLAICTDRDVFPAGMGSSTAHRDPPAAVNTPVAKIGRDGLVTNFTDCQATICQATIGFGQQRFGLELEPAKVR